MCGIIAYTGNKQARDFLVDGLKSLEYRGYDSAGIFISGFGRIRAIGKVANLESKIPKEIQGSTGIAHTRWATHGIPSESNAHPHADEKETVEVVHNGIIENYAELKKDLISKGHIFSSETDTEVIAHLFEDIFEKEKDHKKAFAKTLSFLRGTYGIVLVSKSLPDTLFVARMGSPVVIGIASHGTIVASDPSAVIRHTRDVIFLSDGEMCVISPDEYEICSFNQKTLKKQKEKLSQDFETADKGTYKHFMEKEIFEGPKTVEDVFRGRLNPKTGEVKLGGLESVAKELKRIKRVVIIGCGTAYYAGLVGKTFLEEIAGIPTVADIASEFKYRKPLFDEATLLIAVSQSGETADTLEVVKEAKRHGILTIGVVNVVGSSIARETDAGVYTRAGQEVGVASTKAFLSQVSVFALIALFLGRDRRVSAAESLSYAKALHGIPKKIKEILSQATTVKKLASKFVKHEHAFFVGRKWSYPIALEGALKLKEVSYIHAEGYGAGEMKHGPLALIDSDFPTIVIVPEDEVRTKTLSNIQEIKARKGKIFAIATKGDRTVLNVADDTFYIPKIMESFSPFLSVVPLHLLAYYVSRSKGYDPDKPKNLAKSVTVE